MPLGTPVDRSNVNGPLHRLLESCGLKRCAMAALRHSRASAPFTQRSRPRIVMEQLRHSQIGLTMDAYGHVVPVTRKDAAEALDRHPPRRADGGLSGRLKR
jgi:integrase